jgi:hypothetical protein
MSVSWSKPLLRMVFRPVGRTSECNEAGPLESEGKPSHSKGHSSVSLPGSYWFSIGSGASNSRTRPMGRAKPITGLLGFI